MKTFPAAERPGGRGQCHFSALRQRSAFGSDDLGVSAKTPRIDKSGVRPIRANMAGNSNSVQMGIVACLNVLSISLN